MDGQSHLVVSDAAWHGRVVTAVTGHVIPVEDFLMAVEENDSLLLPLRIHRLHPLFLSHRRMPTLSQDLACFIPREVTEVSCTFN